MLYKICIVCTLAFTTVVGCSDDGVPGQGQNSTATTEASDEPTTTGETAAQTPDDGVDAGQGSTGDPGTTTAEPPGTTGGDDSEGTAATGSETGGTTGSGGESEGSTTGEICEPITEDPSGIGVECRTDLDCEPGYTCQAFEGFVLDLSCQILCEDTCQCPMGLTCTFTQDKAKSWFQCDP